MYHDRKRDGEIRAEDVEALTAAVLASKRIVFFGGAGVSTESGLPDFRSKQGIYRKMPRAESMLTPYALEQDPAAFYRFCRGVFAASDPRPNACHRGLARLEELGRVKQVITQNVDGLHQAAGSRRVLELHGTGRRFRCTRCRYRCADDAVDWETADQRDGVPRCPVCDAVLRPDIVLYREALPPRVLRRAARAIRRSDLLIIAGTSLRVAPASRLVDHARKRVLAIDKAPVPPPGADTFIQAPVAALFEAAMPRIEAALGGAS